uniref:Uncharacterized protein n=1 Tax=Arundo donax TaxID=35708 RepID=A0A0A9DUW5_ARUDO
MHDSLMFTWLRVCSVCPPKLMGRNNCRYGVLPLRVGSGMLLCNVLCK